MSTMASQTTAVSIVCPTVCFGADKRKYQSSASLASVSGIHRSPVDSLPKGPVTRKIFPIDDVIMCSDSLSSSWPTDAIWQRRSGSTFNQVMDWHAVITSASVCLSLCWLSDKLWYLQHSNVGNTIVYRRGSDKQDHQTHVLVDSSGHTVAIRYKIVYQNIFFKKVPSSRGQINNYIPVPVDCLMTSNKYSSMPYACRYMRALVPGEGI